VGRIDTGHDGAQDGGLAPTVETATRSNAESGRPRPWLPIAAGLVGLGIAGAAAVVSLAANVPPLSILADQIVGLAYIGAGAVAWRRRPDNRIGPVMLLAGMTWYIASFQVSDIPAVAAVSFGFACNCSAAPRQDRHRVRLRLRESIRLARQ